MLSDKNKENLNKVSETLKTTFNSVNWCYLKKKEQYDDLCPFSNRLHQVSPGMCTGCSYVKILDSDQTKHDMKGKDKTMDVGLIRRIFDGIFKKTMKPE